MERPKDLRFVPLKYAGRCGSCGTRLKAGERAQWSRSSKKVWCVDCAGGANSSVRAASNHGAGGARNRAAAADPGRLSSSEPADDGPHAAWRQLCSYLQRCVEAEAAATLVPHVRENSLWFLHPGDEKLVVGTSDSMPVPGKLSERLTSRTRSMIYGWPTVVVIDRDHMPKVAPLFIVQIEPKRSSDNQWTVQGKTESEFNLAVTASGIFDLSITEEISDLLSHGLPFGDAEAFAALAGQTAHLLGLQIMSPLNARSLESIISREPGVYNAAISVAAEPSSYTSKLREELRQLRTREDWSTTAAAYLLPDGLARENNTRHSSGPLAAPLSSNQSQEETLQRLRREPLTVVTGPPGTGKTQLVVNAAANAWLDSNKVLVTSTNNGAVNVVAHRAAKDVSDGLLIRTGNRDERVAVPGRITAASEQASEYRGNPAAGRAALKRAATARAQLMEKLARLDELDAELLRVIEQREDLILASKQAARTLWTDAHPPELPISSHQIERRARGLLRRWWFRRFRTRRLRRRLGCLETAPLEQLANWAKIDQRMATLTTRLANKRTDRQQLKSAVGDPASTMRDADQKWADASLRAIRADTAARIASGADRLTAFNTIPAHSDRFKRAVGNSFRHLRGWACTALTADSNFPLESGLFDLVIVDEASQCSLANVLPLTYRAKRLAVVGDPCQLNPIVSLSDRLLQEIATQTGFDNDDLRERGIHHKYGSAYSAFEFAARPQTPVLLNEHYRCHPHIARWFNRTFYRGELTVLTEVSATSRRDRAICWVDVDGTATRPPAGSWLNRAEAEQTVRELHAVIESGYDSVGVVTPFAAQAKLIDQIAKTQIGPDRLAEIEFVSGTAHRFQGGEREAILFSSVLSPDMSPSGARWIEKERNLLNVAVSRACRALIVLGHPLIRDLGSPTLASLRAYLRDEVTRNEGAGTPVAEFRTDSTSETALFEAMQLGGLLPYAKLEEEGYELDFALLEQGIKLNVEVDGDQHLDARGRQRRQDLARDRVLDKLGWTILRIPAWRCHEDINSVIDEINETQDRLLAKNMLE